MAAMAGGPDATDACADGRKYSAVAAQMAGLGTPAADEVNTAVADGGPDRGDGGLQTMVPKVEAVNGDNGGEAANVEEGFNPFFLILTLASSSPVHPLSL